MSIDLGSKNMEERKELQEGGGKGERERHYHLLTMGAFPPHVIPSLKTGRPLSTSALYQRTSSLKEQGTQTDKEFYI